MEHATQPWIVSHTYWIALAPGLGAILNGLLGSRIQKIHRRLPGWIGVAAVGVSVILTWVAFAHMKTLPTDPVTGLRGWEQTMWMWFETTPLTVPFGYLIDPLTMVMLLFVTFIAFLIHVYSTEYMAEDPGVWRFFAYLNLFMFSMLTLILGSSVLTLFIGWEGVGLCSYLLIGFWFKEKANTNAANKAFIVNRVGDLSFVVGLGLLLWATYRFTNGEFTSVTFTEMRQHLDAYKALEAVPFFGGLGVVTIATLLFFGGATGKSAQIPLFVWLPDAMAGPTPVSALIHAATMVTAGVYMIARLNFLFALAPFTLAVVAVVGALTAFFAATIGLFQWDIKRVLAYSTVSQLGYMFLAMGTGAFAAGMFHVFTHAWFKALLFLGSGAVIHAMHHVLEHGVDAQDMRNMGGLKGYMPITFITFFIGWFAIIGVPGLSGFWSKDEILWKAAEQAFFFDNPYRNAYAFAYVLAVLGAVLTAFYMTRQVGMVFFGRYRGDEANAAYKKAHGAHGHHGHDKAHDSDHGHHTHMPSDNPWPMTLPLVVLSVGALCAGFLGLPHWTGIGNWWDTFLEPVFHLAKGGGHTAALAGSLLAEAGHAATAGHAADAGHGAVAAHAEHGPLAWELGLMAISVTLALGSAFFGAMPRFFPPNADPDSLSTALKGNAIYELIYDKYRVDEFYWNTVVWFTLTLRDSVAWLDANIIDGIVNRARFVLLIPKWFIGSFDTFILDGEWEQERFGFVAVFVFLMRSIGNGLRRLQSGDVRAYVRGLGYTVSAVAAAWFALRGF